MNTFLVSATLPSPSKAEMAGCVQDSRCRSQSLWYGLCQQSESHPSLLRGIALLKQGKNPCRARAHLQVASSAVCLLPEAARLHAHLLHQRDSGPDPQSSPCCAMTAVSVPLLYLHIREVRFLRGEHCLSGRSLEHVLSLLHHDFCQHP